MPRSRLGWVGLVLVFVASLLAGLSWAAATPVGASPDDDYHMASIWCPVPLETSGCTLQHDAKGQVDAVQVPSLVASAAACFAFHPEVSGSCTLGIHEGNAWTDRLNHGEYPGLFYQVMHVFVGPDVQQSILLMRAANVAISVALLGGLFLVAAPGQRRIVSLAILAPMVPLGISLVASVNPSGWAFVGLAAAAVGLLVSADAPTRARTAAAAALAVLGAALAVGARGDAGPFLCVAVAGVGLATLRWDRRWLLTRLPGFVVVGVLGLGTYLSSRQATFLADTPPTAVADPNRVLYTNVLELPNLFTGMFGSWALGWLDNPMPATVSASSLFIAIAVIVVGVTALNAGKTLGLGIVALVLVVVPLLLLQGLGMTVGQWVQPRYLLPLAPVFLGIMAYDPRRRAGVDFTVTQRVLVACLAAFAFTIALYTTFRRYLTGLDGTLVLGRSVEWWWRSVPGPRIVYVMGVLSFTVVAFALMVSRRDVVRLRGGLARTVRRARRLGAGRPGRDDRGVAPADGQAASAVTGGPVRESAEGSGRAPEQS